MILNIRCDRPSFKTVPLKPGFNVVLADRTKESTKKDSRNGLGKSTLVEIVHFCLGSSARPGKGLMVKRLNGWAFSMDLEIAGRQFSVSRSTEHPGGISLTGDLSRLSEPDGMANPERLPLEGPEGRRLATGDWTSALGAMLFDLPVNGFPQTPYQPSFRSLISYFIRRGRDAYSTAFEHHRKQIEWDRQVNNAFLLGLSWENASAAQVLKDKRKLVQDLQQAARAGMMDGILGSIGELEARRVQLQERASEETAGLDGFRVHPQYRQIEDEANHLTESIHLAANENLAQTRLLQMYERSVSQEQEPGDDTVARMFEEAGVALPGMVVRRLEDVQQFHRDVVRRRREFLRREIDRLRASVLARERSLRTLTDQRAEILQTLRTHRALDEYTRLQELHARTVAEIEALDARIAAVKQFEEGRSELRVEQELLQQRAVSDYDDRRVQREKAIALFNANSRALYDAPGALLIDVGPNGFTFDVRIQRSGSTGIEAMKVFCYDLMLAQLWSERSPSPGVLVHDSTIFDGVDERQVAQALDLAARESARCGFQYLCMLNSDTIPWDEFSPGFDLNSYVRLRLTDATPDGGLLGIRF